LDSDSFRGGRSCTDSDGNSPRRTGHLSHDTDQSEGSLSFDSTGPSVIEEVSEPASPETIGPKTYRGRQSPFIPPSQHPDLNNHAYSSLGGRWGDLGRAAGGAGVPEVAVEDVDISEDGENAPLLPRTRLSQPSSKHPYGAVRQSWSERPASSGIRTRLGQTLSISRNYVRAATNPKNYTKEAVAHNAVAGVQVLSAVFLGLLLNVLDGLSYGIVIPLMILDGELTTSRVNSVSIGRGDLLKDRTRRNFNLLCQLHRIPALLLPWAFNFQGGSGF
jgi:SulP family sulfate permease